MSAREGLLRWGLIGALPNRDALYVREAARGASDGRDWANAASKFAIGKAVEAANDAGIVRLLATDAFAVTATLNRFPISRLVASDLVTIRGAAADGSASKVTFNGTRKAYNGVNDTRQNVLDGTDAFFIAHGAKKLKISNMIFNNMGFCFHCVGDFDDLTFEDIDANNVALFFNNKLNLSASSSAADTFTCRSLTLRRVTGTGYEYGLFRIGQNLDHVVIDDCHGDALRYVGNNNAFQEGVHLNGNITLAEVMNSSMNNSQFTGTGYYNGDGFASESVVTEVRYTDCSATGSSDGGWDDKAATITRTRCVATQNKISFRTWGADLTMTDCESHLPEAHGGSNAPEHFQFNGNGGGGTAHVATLNHPIIRGDATHKGAVFNVSDTFLAAGKTLTVYINDYDISVPTDVVVVDNDNLAFTPNFVWGSPAAGCPAYDPVTNRMTA